MVDVKLEPVEISAAPGGANVSVRGFVPLPLGPLPTPQEQTEKYQVAISQLKAALPELIPLLVLELVQAEIERRSLGQNPHPGELTLQKVSVQA